MLIIEFCFVLFFLSNFPRPTNHSFNQSINQSKSIIIIIFVYKANVLRTFCPDEWKYSFLTIYSMNNLGLAIAFAISEFICLYIKIYSLIIILIFACIPMQLCELRLMKFEKILGPGSQSQL